MADHRQNRDKLLDALTRELVGPDPQGDMLDCSGDVEFETFKDSWGPWRQQSTGDEILTLEPPTRRYGVGVLFPPDTRNEDVERGDEETASPGLFEPGEEGDDEDVESEWLVENGVSDPDKSDAPGDDFDLSLANAYRPSSMGISFLAEVAPGSSLHVEVSFARYIRKVVQIAEQPRDWWLRRARTFPVDVEADALTGEGAAYFNESLEVARDRTLEVQVLSRPRPDAAKARLITVSLVNRSTGAGRMSEKAFFQVGFSASMRNAPDTATHSILPYPRPARARDEEEAAIDLLYRHAKTFAVGHGCAAQWDPESGTDQVSQVRAVALPVVQTPSVTPEIQRDDGSLLEIDMAKLGGLRGDDDREPLDDLSDLVSRYEDWIQEKELTAQSLAEHNKAAARRHLNACTEVADRMRRGLRYLRDNPTARRAFELANLAVLLQQIQSTRPLRELGLDGEDQHLAFSALYEEPDPLAPPENRGKWRPFQIAFMLTALESTARRSSAERDIVELLWFPTGGGKTEAYLGLIAFSIFLRRLRDPSNAGVEALMRYTLRLLTAQQFQRAARLLCAMEHIRRGSEEDLGEAPFSIGIWLGSTMTPNYRREAISALEKLRRGKRNAENPFLLVECPWCRAQIGPVRLGKGAPNVVGYERRGDTVALTCSDPDCPFYDGLPVLVIDEDVYVDRPDLVIGTIDKFAMLAWRPEACGIFGLNAEGVRTASPPGLIIQDELHLISGPLGSVAGLFEAVVEELCTDHRQNTPTGPKIVCSTATIRTHEEQVRALYARRRSRLFPPPGIEASDSFFAHFATDENGELLPGRAYVGVHASGLTSFLDAQGRVLATLLQAPEPFSDEARDPWWTNLVFFNSLRELGTTLSQLQSYIPGYLKDMNKRRDSDRHDIRFPRYTMELTGRLEDEDVPKALARLEQDTISPGAKPVDVCLASSIIEVGVDVDRLSLMTVISQPKTTAQYIQVTGRIGRRWWERPGLVVTVYSPTRPRDRSHYEHFQSYHQRLYAQVEPTSVTPFSEPVLKRALPAIMAVYVRQMGTSIQAQDPWPVPDALLDELERHLITRAGIVDQGEVETLKRLIQARRREWAAEELGAWEPGTQQDSPIPRLRPAGEFAPKEWGGLPWKTPRSMRNVDAQCQAIVTGLYRQDNADDYE